MQENQNSSPDPVALAAFAGAVLIGGSNFVAVRLSNRELEPFWGAGGRFVLAALLFAGLVAVTRTALPQTSGGWTRAALYGLLAIGGTYGFLYWGMLEVPAGVASVVMAAAPLLTLCLAIAHRMEPFASRALVGALLALCGTAAMLLQPSQLEFSLASLLAVIAGTLCAAESVIIAKRSPDVHPYVMNAVGMIVGGAVLLLASLAAGETRAIPSTSEAQLAVAYLILFSVPLFLLFFVVVRRWTASATSYIFVLFPVVAVLVAALVADEPITWSTAAGAALVMAAVYVGALRRTE